MHIKFDYCISSAEDSTAHVPPVPPLPDNEEIGGRALNVEEEQVSADPAAVAAAWGAVNELFGLVEVPPPCCLDLFRLGWMTGPR